MQIKAVDNFRYWEAREEKLTFEVNEEKRKRRQEEDERRAREWQHYSTS